MGLEGVQLIMATEEEFGIKFSDDEAYKFDTPAKVIDCIYELIGQDNSGRCASQQEIDKLWVKEVERRCKDVESGRAKLISGEKVFKKIRKRFGK